MSEQMIAIELPISLFRKLERAANVSKRSVNEVLTSTLNATLVAPPNLPSNLSDELAAMHLLSDTSLWNAVQPSLLPAEHSRLQQLNHLAGSEALSQVKAAEQAKLLNAYHYSVLRRAQAMAILAQRGHSISPETLSAAYSNDDRSSFPNGS